MPKIREALASGKIGWCKASRVASVATPQNEVMWLDSALSLTVQQLERRIRDGTDSLASAVHFVLTEDRRILWKHALEIYRRRAGAEISPVEAFELMCAEVIAAGAHHLTDEETTDTSTPEEVETPDDDPVSPEAEASTDEPPADDPCEQAPLFPWAEASDSESVRSWPDSKDERAAENEFASNDDYNQIRHFVLERDSWKCTYPGCEARAKLHVHHIRFRSRGGCDLPWNLTVVCHFHHLLIHSEQIGIKGRAPFELEWTPPKLMRAVLDRRRNNPSIWLGDLDVREWSLETRASPS